MRPTLYFLCLMFLFNLLAAQVNKDNLFLTNTKQSPFKNPPNNDIDEITIPPALSVRAMAEWEELQSIVLTWSWAWNQEAWDVLLSQITTYAREECDVIILCDDIPRIQQKLETLANITDYQHPIIRPGGVLDTTSITFLNISDIGNRIWVRDYGAHTIYLEDVDTLAFVDWIYDLNAIYQGVELEPSATYAEHYGSALYATTEDDYALRLDGGNFMTDGLGSAFSSDIVAAENDCVPPNCSFFQTIEAFMGIHNWHDSLPSLENVGRKHIDMYLKLLDEETVIIGSYPDWVCTNHDELERNVAFFEQLSTPFGREYDIIRVPFPPDENGHYPNHVSDNLCEATPIGEMLTYTNALFINRTILVPTYNEQYDSTALRLWQETMPGYKIIGLDCNDIIQFKGAIHCITKEVGVKNPLWIVHPKIRKACIDDTTYPVKAVIKHISGIREANVFYKTADESTFHQLPMEALNEHDFEAHIPHQPMGTKVQYYIHAIANSGKVMVRPMPAPEAYWTFEAGNCLETNTDDIWPNTLVIQNIYPNPATEHLFVEIFDDAHSHIQLKMLDITGRLINILYEGSLPQKMTTLKVDVTDLAAGIYFIEMKGEWFSDIWKVVIQK